MSSAPSLQRIAETVRAIGEQHRHLADELDELGRRGGLRPTSRSELLEMVRALLTELGVLSPPSPPPSTSPSTSPSTPTPTPISSPSEDSMPILFRDFAYAHARVAMKGDDIAIERGTGFERQAYLATKLPEPACAPGATPLSRAPATLAVPRNTQLVRLQMTADHQIDADEAVVIAVPADRETAYRYEVTAIPVNDRTIDVAVRAVEPDTNAPLTVARFHVLVFRVA